MNQKELDNSFADMFLYNESMVHIDEDDDIVKQIMIYSEEYWKIKRENRCSKELY